LHRISFELPAEVTMFLPHDHEHLLSHNTNY